MNKDRREFSSGRSFVRSPFIARAATEFSEDSENSLGIPGFTEQDISDIVNSPERVSAEEANRINEMELHQSFCPNA